MMYAALKFVRDELNEHLNRVFLTDSDSVLISTVHEPDGSISPKITDKIVISLVNTERTNMHGRAPASISSGGASLVVRSEPLYVNLFILVAASFSDYPLALKNLSQTAEYFQSRKEMTRDSFSNLPDGIENLDLQLENMTIHDLSNLWGMMGGKHYPSLLYKMRMVTIDSGSVIGKASGIRQPAMGVEP